MAEDQRSIASLEERLRIIENEDNQGTGFSGRTWALLVLTGILGPALLLVWGAA